MVMRQLNLAFCVFILVLSLINFVIYGNTPVLIIGVAFGLFGIDRLARLSGMNQHFNSIFMAIRIAAYILVGSAIICMR